MEEQVGPFTPRARPEEKAGGSPPLLVRISLCSSLVPLNREEAIQLVQPISFSFHRCFSFLTYTLLFLSVPPFLSVSVSVSLLSYSPELELPSFSERFRVYFTLGTRILWMMTTTGL